MKVTAQELRASDLEVQFAAQVEAAQLPEPAWGRNQSILCGHKVDFSWVEYQVCVEIQGATWAQGRHTRGKGYAQDRMLSNMRQVEGWICLEFTAEHLNQDLAIEIVKRALRERGYDEKIPARLDSDR